MKDIKKKQKVNEWNMTEKAISTIPDIAAAARPERTLEQKMTAIIRTLNGIPIRLRDLQTVSPKQWLNDEIMNAYLFLITQAPQKRKRHKTIHTFPIAFFQYLRMSYTDVRKWTKSVTVLLHLSSRKRW